MNPQPWMNCRRVEMRGTPVNQPQVVLVPVPVPVAVVIMITPPTIIDVRGHETGWPGEVEMVPVEDFFDGELPNDDGDVTMPGDYMVLEVRTGTDG